MPREVCVKTVVPDCDVDKFFKVCLKSRSPLERFHSIINKTENPTVTDWTDLNERTVRFTMALDLPAIMKSLVGADTVKVVEQQRYQWQDGSLLFFSEPATQGVPMSTKMSVKIVHMITNIGDELEPAVEVEATCVVAAHIAWPLCKSVEATMASDTKNSLIMQMDFYKQLLVEYDNHIPSAEQFPEQNTRLQRMTTLKIVGQRGNDTAEATPDALDQPAERVPSRLVSFDTKRLPARQLSRLETSRFFDAVEVADLDIPEDAVPIHMEDMVRMSKEASSLNTPFLNGSDSMSVGPRSLSRLLSAIDDKLRIKVVDDQGQLTSSVSTVVNLYMYLLVANLLLLLFVLCLVSVVLVKLVHRKG